SSRREAERRRRFGVFGANEEEQGRMERGSAARGTEGEGMRLRLVELLDAEWRRERRSQDARGSRTGVQSGGGRAREARRRRRRLERGLAWSNCAWGSEALRTWIGVGDARVIDGRLAFEPGLTET